MAQVLQKAAEEAGRAPSILNTQPWRWRVRDDVLELYGDTSRQITSIDPEGRLLTLSCGAALHHARVALAFAGHEPAGEGVLIVACSRRPSPCPPTPRQRCIGLPKLNTPGCIMSAPTSLGFSPRPPASPRHQPGDIIDTTPPD